MKNRYTVQVNDYMTPVNVMLTDEQVEGVVNTLKAIADGDHDSLVEIADEDSNEIYSNYDEWIKTHENEKPSFTGKYFIQMVSNMYGKQKICYRKYKCSDGWSENMDGCWEFTKQGALKKIEALKREYHINYDKGLLEFNLVECWK